MGNGGECGRMRGLSDWGSPRESAPHPDGYDQLFTHKEPLPPGGIEKLFTHIESLLVHVELVNT